MKGFCLDIEGFTSENYAKIKALGFDTVLLPVWFGRMVDENLNVNWDVMNRADEHAKLAQAQGLHVVLSSRVQYADPPQSWTSIGWANPPRADFVNMTSDGLTKYGEYLARLVHEIRGCTYCLWHFPYHAQNIDDARRHRLWNVTYPYLINRVRQVTKNALIIVPPHQGIYDLYHQDDADWYLDHDPLEGSNLLYGCNHMMDWQVIAKGQQWNGDVERVNRAFAGIRNARSKGMRLVSVEFGTIHFYGGAIDQNRLDYLAEVMKHMNQNNVDILYWIARKRELGGDNAIINIENFEVEPNLLKLLQTATPPTTGCFIATACGTSNSHLDTLRSFRDRYLPNRLVDAYYLLSPPVADRIRRHENVKTVIRGCVECLAKNIQNSLTLR